MAEQRHAGDGSQVHGPNDATSHQLGRMIMERLLSKLQDTMSRLPLDLDYLEFLCSHELLFISSVYDQISVPEELLGELSTLKNTVDRHIDNNNEPVTALEVEFGVKGPPKFIISREHLQYLVNMQLSVPCIAELLGVSTRTIKRRLTEYGISLKDTYSKITDEELDNLVRSIKAKSPHLGHRMMKGHLQALGHRVPWTRVWDSMHRVDSAGILARITQLRCVVRRTYSVKGPLHVVHIDTNHKLIRYGLVIFGAIDGYSRKIMYLGPATDNKASTALGFFLQSVERHGFPLRVRGDQGVENVEIARCMFSVRGCGRGSYISGKSMHNQRIERLWRDIWMAVTNIYYDVLHSLEEEGLLEPTNSLHLFCCQFVFLPRLQASLDSFTSGWNNHPLRTESNRSPDQLWEIGLLQNPVPPPVQSEIAQDDDSDWDTDSISDQPWTGIVVPPVECPLTEELKAQIQTFFNPTSHSQNYGRDKYLEVLNFVLLHS
ncbi:uncharacterized protein LOC132131733 [Carassius carassius]|uniref:uncharacterized protein LOC132131733 n=1 Tax=Carassius carassius TaxID=217509 RepID=UPI0028689793|nr:uncharacterized protein LOC132131733 [Carassius carassius]